MSREEMAFQIYVALMSRDLAPMMAKQHAETSWKLADEFIESRPAPGGVSTEDAKKAGASF